MHLENEINRRADHYTELPLEHLFAPGVYVRKAFLAKGSVIIGKIHRHEHANIIARGCVDVFTEFDDKRHTAYTMFVSPVGVKRAIYAVEDTDWVCVHLNPTNETDLDKLEGINIAPSYAALGWEIPSLERIT